MSFSSQIKEELSQLNTYKDKLVVQSELYGYLSTLDQTGSTITFQTENQYNINRLNKLLNNQKIPYKIKMNGPNYQITFSKKHLPQEWEAPLQTEETTKAFVRGTFLGSGWITEPNSKYHLEIGLKTEERQKPINTSNNQIRHPNQNPKQKKHLLNLHKRRRRNLKTPSPNRSKQRSTKIRRHKSPKRNQKQHKQKSKLRNRKPHQNRKRRSTTNPSNRKTKKTKKAPKPK